MCTSTESISKYGTVSKQLDYPQCTYGHASVAINSSTWITTGSIRNGLAPEYDEELLKKTYFYNSNKRQFVSGPQLLTGRIHHAAGMLHDMAGDDRYTFFISPNTDKGR